MENMGLGEGWFVVMTVSSDVKLDPRPKILGCKPFVGLPELSHWSKPTMEITLS